MESGHYIGLLDCNNFFVSCERLFRPDLLQQPTIVLSSNDGCVVARSQEVKDMGIPMGVPYFKIKDVVKDRGITVFSGNMTLYRDISSRVFTIVGDEIDLLEQYSIDECFFSMQGSLSEVVEQVQRLRGRILRDVGIPVSIGLAKTKTLAKCAATQAKQGSGVSYVRAADCTDIPLGTIWGVGRGLTQRFREHSLQTVADLVTSDQAQIRSLYGVVGERLQRELQGQSVYPVEMQETLKQSLTSSRTFGRETVEFDVIADAVTFHARLVGERLRTMNAQAGCIRVSLKTNRYSEYFLYGGSLESRLVVRTSDTLVLVREAVRLAQEVYADTIPYNKVGITVSDIAHCGSQGVLFQECAPADTAELMRAIDVVNTRHDRTLVQIGSRLRHASWESQGLLRSQSYTTQWSNICVVSATVS